METLAHFAIIGPTASGKTALAIEVAHQKNANILSLDSLAIYKEIDIVSAKPTLQERQGIPHYGLDLLLPNEAFNVHTFTTLYQQALQHSHKENKGLIIVGGTSFYLKMLIDGLSKHPTISQNTQNEVKAYLNRLPEAYAFLNRVDKTYMQTIEPHDIYRIEKALQIYLETQQTPTQYFKENPPQKVITTPLPIYQIEVEKPLLRQRIYQRTQEMLQQGLIDEIVHLEHTYTRTPNCMKAIGIKETLAYLDGYYTKDELLEKITTNTARLAKRQTTFNQTQFQNVKRESLEKLRKELLRK
jgi:tRNA dimethylallyltransferase